MATVCNWFDGDILNGRCPCIHLLFWPLCIYLNMYILAFIYVYMYICVYEIYLSDYLSLYICIYVFLYSHVYTYIYIYIYIYRLPPLPPNSKKSAGIDCCVHFGGTGFAGVLLASLLWHLDCTDVPSKANVGYLAFLCRREHRFRDI